MQAANISEKLVEIFSPQASNEPLSRAQSRDKIKVGIFTFTCCEDSTIMLTEIMNDYLLEWLKRIDFVEARVLRKHRPDVPLDVVFVEGAITAQEQAEKLKQIRARSKKLVTIGSCACTGMPSAQRNDFDQKTTEEIEFILDRFKYADKVRKISDIVKVDALIPGCPMNTDLFLKTLNQVFIEYGFNPVELDPGSQPKAGTASPG